MRRSGLDPGAKTVGHEISCVEITMSEGPTSTSYIRGIEAFIDGAPRMDIDYAEIFNVDPGPITERRTAVDISQIVLAPPDPNPSFNDYDSYVQGTTGLDLVANGLGPTAVVKRGRVPFDPGLDFTLLQIFLGLLVTVLAGLALARWKLT